MRADPHLMPIAKGLSAYGPAVAAAFEKSDGAAGQCVTWVSVGSCGVFVLVVFCWVWEILRAW
jgi:hypothetical protein